MGCKCPFIQTNFLAFNYSVDPFMLRPWTATYKAHDLKHHFISIHMANKRRGSDPYTHTTQQWHNTKAQWSGVHVCGLHFIVPWYCVIVV
jgi:hypothetical protein